MTEFRKVSGERTYFKYKECSPKDVLVAEGRYIGPEQGKFGVQHLFDTGDGRTTVLNSAGHLNYLLDKHVQPGMVCRVTYDGKEVLTKGPMKGKESHNFIVEVADDGTRADEVEKRTAAAPTDTAPRTM